MLFIDDDEAELCELYFLFDESVGADGELGFTAEETGAGLALGIFIERAGEQGDAIGLARGRRELVGKQLACA